MLRKKQRSPTQVIADGKAVKELFSTPRILPVKSQGGKQPPSRPQRSFLPHDKAGRRFVTTVVCNLSIFVWENLQLLKMAPHLSNDEVCLHCFWRSHIVNLATRLLRA